MPRTVQALHLFISAFKKQNSLIKCKQSIFRKFVQQISGYVGTDNNICYFQNFIRVYEWYYFAIFLFSLRCVLNSIQILFCTFTKIVEEKFFGYRTNMGFYCLTMKSAKIIKSIHPSISVFVFAAHFPNQKRHL